MSCNAAELSKPRLLVVSPTFPFPLIAGGRLRIYHLLRCLSRDFDITLLALIEGPDDTKKNREALGFLDELHAIPIKQSRWQQVFRLLRNFPLWLQGMPAELLVKRSSLFARELAGLVASGRYDCIQFEYIQTTQYLDLALQAGLPAVLVAHDVSFVSQRRKAEVKGGLQGWFWASEAKRMERFEVRQWAKFHRVVAMSEVDRRHVAAVVDDRRIDVVPNGVDIDGIKVMEEGELPSLIYVGWMRHLPNRDAVEWFLSEIWPLIKAKDARVRFRVVGKGLPKHIVQMIDNDERVDYLGFVEDVSRVVGESWVSVVPLRIGSGSRLKILESMALGTPVVTTSIGCEGIEATPGTEVLVADTIDRFAERVVALLQDRALRAKLAAKGRRRVEDSYDWNALAAVAARSWQQLCHDGHHTEKH